MYMRGASELGSGTTDGGSTVVLLAVVDTKCDWMWGRC
jgi:hypothetical protein